MEEKKLAIIVPMFNVENYLEECLDSLLKQGLSADEMQIIIIDDGSTDNSIEIAQKFVDKYPRTYELHYFNNKGPGALRNEGIKLANAKFITYVDSDDKVVPNSYEYMLNILKRTGSQVITGNAHRFDTNKEWPSWIQEKSHIGNFEQTTFDEHPELIWDTTSWNKIYDLSFLRENNLQYPEDILYEDIPYLNSVFAAAPKIDIIKKVVYLWRKTEGSITESSTEMRYLFDRITATELTLESLRKLNSSENIVKLTQLKSLNFGLLVMLSKEHYDFVANETKEKLFKELKRFLNKIPVDTLFQANFDKLIYFDKVLKVNTQEEFDEITSKFLKNEVEFYGYWNDAGQYVLKSDFSDLEKIAMIDDLEIHPKVEEVVFEDDLLKIQGFFYLKHSDMSAPENVKVLGISALSDDGNTIIDIAGEIKIFENKKITAKYGYNLNHFVKDGADFNYDYSGYELKIPLKNLYFDTTEFLSFLLKVEIDGLKFEVPIKNPVGGVATRPDVVLSGGNIYCISYDSAWNLLLQLKDTNILELCLSNDGKELRIKGNVNKIALKSGKKTLPLKLIGGQVMISHTVQEKIKSLDKSVFHWWYFVAYVNGEEIPLYYFGNPKDFQNEANLEILCAQNGRARLAVSYLYPLIKSLDVKNENLYLAFNLRGWMAEATKIQILADPKLDILWETEKVNENLYQLSLPLTLDGFSDKEWLNFHVRLTFQDGYQTDELLRWGQEKFDLKNQWVSAGGVGWYFRAITRFKHCGFSLLRQADKIERESNWGALDQFLQTDYQKWQKEPILEDVVVWSAYWGRDNKFGGNPRAFYDYAVEHYPNLKHIIVIKNAIRSYPEFKNTKVISFGTKAYWYYLAKAKYFVNDVNFTERQRYKRENQIEIQTMHGTPLKTMGFDVLSEWRDSTYHSFHRRFMAYDYLVVPSDWVAEYATKSFQISPRILSTGYPRNDIFFKDYTDIEINNLKKKFKIPLDKKIVLYSPTYRKQKNESSNISTLLDIQSLYKKLSHDMFILIKNHPFEKLTGISKKYQNKIQFADQSATIEELYIISDAVITDYSSVMFDYSLLNKPMIFWTPDYDEYMGNRGLNFDLKEDAPGPILDQQKDLENWLNHLEEIPVEFEDKISQFKEKFAQYDQGNASEQISKIIWGDAE